jgi:hypothetical protein
MNRNLWQTLAIEPWLEFDVALDRIFLPEGVTLPYTNEDRVIEPTCGPWAIIPTHWEGAVYVSGNTPWLQQGA